MKRILTVLLALMLVFSLATVASAKTHTGEDDWDVTFTAANKMVSNFETRVIDDVILGMQPGDDAIVTLHLQNMNAATTRWYMKNNVIDSLEDDSLTAAGGAYTYTLIYTDVNGVENVLFDSDTVGGEHISNAGEGLNEATNALDDFFYLDTLTTGQEGDITLRVALEGETQGNDYQDTLADLEMQFAVELLSNNGSRTPVVQTGDETNLMPFIIAALVSGALLLFFAIFSLKHRKKEAK